MSKLNKSHLLRKKVLLFYFIQRLFEYRTEGIEVVQSKSNFKKRDVKPCFGGSDRLISRWPDGHHISTGQQVAFIQPTLFERRTTNSPAVNKQKGMY